jgi:phosphohistidine swiveling domain-containing protein
MKSSKIEHTLKKEDYIYLGQYKSPLLYHWLCQKWVNHRLAKENGLPELDGRLLLLDGHLFFYKKDWEIIKQLTKEAIDIKNTFFFSDMFMIANAEINNVLDISRILLDSKSDDITHSLLKRFLEAAHDMEFPWFFVIPMGEALEEAIRNKLASAKMPEDSIKPFFATEKPTLLMKQKRDMASIKRRLSEENILEQIECIPHTESSKLIKKMNPELYNDINDHIKKFRWFGMMHFWGSPFTHEKFFEQIRAININNAENTEEPILRLDDELSWLKKCASDLSYCRNHLAEVCAIASHAALEKLGYISKKRGLDYSDAYWLTPDEFLDFAEGRLSPLQENIDDRKKAFGLVTVDNENIILTGEKLSDVLNVFLDKYDNVKEINGISASKGIARGKVKIVLSPFDIYKVKEGDIMVAPETTPDFVPAVQRAKAIITDMGGIISHAAIISREFGIPCVVGTRNATKVLKDGDYIELDANKGTVKKL